MYKSINRENELKMENKKDNFVVKW